MNEGKVANLTKVDDWNEIDQRRLELNMGEWEAPGMSQSADRRTCFDTLWWMQERLLICL